jgi:hypothetical protein
MLHVVGTAAGQNWVESNAAQVIFEAMAPGVKRPARNTVRADILRELDVWKGDLKAKLRAWCGVVAPEVIVVDDADAAAGAGPAAGACCEPAAGGAGRSVRGKRKASAQLAHADVAAEAAQLSRTDKITTALTLDMWTSHGAKADERKYMAVTMHTMSETFEIMAFTLAMRVFPGQHTAGTTADLLRDILREYDLTMEHVSGITTDNGSNVVAASKLLAEDAVAKERLCVRVPCFAHTLQLVIHAAMVDGLPPDGLDRKAAIEALDANDQRKDVEPLQYNQPRNCLYNLLRVALHDQVGRPHGEDGRSAARTGAARAEADPPERNTVGRRLRRAPPPAAAVACAEKHDAGGRGR